jgi:hypothetical protein
MIYHHVCSINEGPYELQTRIHTLTRRLMLIMNFSEHVWGVKSPEKGYG